MNTLLDSPKYKTFIHDRDQALEQIHLNTQLDLSRMLHEVLDRIESFIAKLGIKHDLNVYNMSFLSQQLDSFVIHQFAYLMPALVKRIESMRQNVFLLTYASEAEAIGRATQKKLVTSPEIFKVQMAKAKSDKTLLGEDLSKRVWLSLYKLRNDIMEAFNLSLVQELPPRDIIEKVKGAFPKVQTYIRPPRNLKPVREAKFDPNDPNDPNQKEWLDLGFVSDSDWNQAVDAYKDTELSPTRFDQSQATSGAYAQYNWELEQDVTDDFVNQVRSGQIQAAKDLGVKDFVWVAIIDKKTDDCCLKRNGHTTQEIKDMLSNGKLNAETCDATSPPAHPNCRCTIAPIASTDEVQGPDWKSFGDWLNS